MCGIFGYAGRISKSKNHVAFRLLKNVAIASEVRGVDATGFSARWPRDRVVADKMPLRAEYFCNASFKFKNLIKAMPTTFIGHTRLGTGSGRRINNNNHPFFGQRYHMVHNGIIPSWKTVAEDAQVKMSSETDSEIILRTIEKQIEDNRDIQEASEWLLNNIWGNMAVALLDKRMPFIWIFRNENPCWIFEIPQPIFGDKVWFFASTKDIFNNGWEKTFKLSSEKCGVDAHLLDQNTLYRLASASRARKVGEKRIRAAYFPLKITKRFRKKKQYYGPITGLAADEKGRFEDYNPFRCYFTKCVNVNKPEMGSKFSPEDRNKIEKFVNKYDKKCSRTLLDGLTLQEFVRLQDILDEFRVLNK